MGDVSDMTEVAEHLHSTHPSSTIVAAGVSMGRWELKSTLNETLHCARYYNVMQCNGLALYGRLVCSDSVWCSGVYRCWSYTLEVPVRFPPGQL